MINPFAHDPDRELTRASVRAQLHGLRDDCRVLDACLPGGAPWRGVAHAAYQARLLRVRARLAAAVAAIEAAEIAL